MPDGRGKPIEALPGTGLFLLFAAGGRPDRVALREALAGHGRGMVSFDPASVPAPDAQSWLELLYDGLTFDCLGLAPGPALALPARRHRLHLDAGGDDTALETMGLFPGPHCAAAAHTLPVVRAQLALGLALAGKFAGLAQVVWGPSATAMAPAFFLRAVEGWLGGGPFPALALVAYRLLDDGALASSGLAFFTGQELRIAVELASDPAAATRLAARLIHELVAAPSIREPRDFLAPGGQALRLQPDDGGTLVTVVPA